MAQGQGSRWAGGQSKCLAPINGEPMVARIVRQLHEHGQLDVTIIGSKAEFAPHVEADIYEVDHPSPELCYGIKDTSHLWLGADRVAILLGDTVYSQYAIEAILSDTEPIRVFGRMGENKVTGKPFDERVALVFDVLDWGMTILHAINLILAMPHCTRALKSLYHELIGAPCGRRDLPFVCFEDDILFELGDDYTDDIDSLEEYERCKGSLEAAIIAELQEKTAWQSK